MVQRNIGRTSDLVQDLLSYSKEREPEFQSCFPNEIADDVCELVKENAAENDVEIVKDFSTQVGEVVMDPRSIHRCLLNLVSNAIDACRFDESAGKKHCVTVTTALEKDNIIRFDVKDNGSGMDEEVKDKLFSSFFSTKGAQGTGLGLLVTSKLIEEQKGTINVTSRLGEGTTFSLRLPFARDG
jgi:signal transduction histidine kinase